MTREDLDQTRIVMREQLQERLTSTVADIRQEFSELRIEFGKRIDGLDRRMDALERRMDRIAETTGIEMNLAALTCWANRADRENLELRSTQIAQQNAIDLLVKRLSPPEQPSH